jgi:hypothetical protein
MLLAATVARFRFPPRPYALVILSLAGPLFLVTALQHRAVDFRFGKFGELLSNRLPS